MSGALTQLRAEVPVPHTLKKKKSRECSDSWFCSPEDHPPVLSHGLCGSGGQQREPQTWECIRVRGKVAPHAKGFMLNLGTDGNSRCLYFNPRFKIHGDVNKTACNSKNAGVGGKEHRESVFPFQPGSVAEVCITFDKAELIIIKLPDGYTFKFPNRLNLETNNYTGAEGDFKVNCVTFE